MKIRKLKKIVEKTIKNLKKLDKFNTDLVFGAYKLEYELTDSVSKLVHIYVYDTYKRDYAEIVNRTKYGKDGEIQLFINLELTSYIRLQELIKIFYVIQDEFERNLNEKTIR